MAYDDKAKATAAAKLAPKSNGGKGQQVTISWTTGDGTYDKSTGRVTPGAPASQACSGIEEEYQARQVDGELIKVGDKRFMLSPLTVQGDDITLPEPGASLTYADGTLWRIERVGPFRPAGVLIYVYLQLRGA